MFTQMKTPLTRMEFERAFHFAAEHMRQGKFHLPRGADDYLFSLQSVRYLPNKRLDFLSVDERARLNANMTLNMMTGTFREDLEKTDSPEVPSRTESNVTPKKN